MSRLNSKSAHEPVRACYSLSASNGEKAGEGCRFEFSDFPQKQQFLNTVYEKFFQGFCVKLADTLAIVYTPRSIVLFMVRSGGKFSHLDFILPLLPPDFTHFCEPFGGSAAVLINRPPAPVETYNDLDGEAVNFFECLRDQGDKLIRAISLTPFSRQELIKALSRATGLAKL